MDTYTSMNATTKESERMKHNTCELEDTALDWAVSLITNPEWDDGDRWANTFDYVDTGDIEEEPYCPSSNWSQGGPIIEREGILLRPVRKPGHPMDGVWLAMYDGGNTGQMVQWVEFLFKNKNRRLYSSGPTALVAAMRCFVAKHLGEQVTIPEELTGQL